LSGFGKTSRVRLRVAARLVLVLVLAVTAGGSRAFPPDSDVREILRRQVDVSKRAPGLVVAMADESGVRVVAYGRVRRGSDEPVSGDTVFEVGSVTKVFTSLLLAQMVQAGEVRLDDSITKSMPLAVKSPRTRQVTLLHLSRHTAGFPPFPDNIKPVDPLNALDVYSNEALFAFVARYGPTRAPGTFHVYSNVGPALLGELLARRARTDYETALKQRILEPLGMRDTGNDDWSPVLPGRAAGYAKNRQGEVINADPINMSIALGAGSMYSTAEDLLRWNNALDEGKLLSPELVKQIFTAHGDSDFGDKVGYGWFLGQDKHGHAYAGMLGGINGFATQVTRFPGEKLLVIVLANQSHTRVNDVANGLEEIAAGMK